jgi:hypothetical protein
MPLAGILQGTCATANSTLHDIDALSLAPERARWSQDLRTCRGRLRLGILLP